LGYKYPGPPSRSSKRSEKKNKESEETYKIYIMWGALASKRKGNQYNGDS
jgi:hypothetical protein